MNTKITNVDCPNCKKSVEWKEENSFRPFCSKRCKLIDFGEWASERNSIPGESVYPVIEDKYETNNGSNSCRSKGHLESKEAFP